MNPPLPVRTLRFGALPVEIFPDGDALGRAAAAAVAAAIRERARAPGMARLVIGTGSSQLAFIAALTAEPGVPWDRVECFHLDEYLGMGADHPASFRRWLRERVAEVVRPGRVHYVAGDAPDPQAEAARYTALLRAAPLDIACIGFGENGHVAFNDPPFADFADPLAVKVVRLAERSRGQQVGERHFPDLAAVPAHALTLTIPAVLAARQVFAIVPEARKAAAVRAALLGPVTPGCPASILREQPHARLFLDADSAAQLDDRRDKAAALDAIVRQGFVPIFVPDAHDPRRLVEAAVAAGCRAIEFSCRRPDAPEMIPWIKREFPNLAVLAATLVDGPRAEAHLKRTRPGFLTVDKAAGLGADGLVSFMRFRPETYAQHGRACVMIPGVANQNEALDQLELGADLIKTTVHTAAGADFVTKTGAVTHHCIPFFISGGVNAANLESYLQAGVAVTAAGFDVLLGKTTAGGSELVASAREAIGRMVAAVQAAREKHQPALAAAIQTGAADLIARGPWLR